MPGLYIITGSNGAGKSSVGPEYLPPDIQRECPVFDGDLIYTMKLRELFPEVMKSAKYARKEALEYVVDLFEQQTFRALASNANYAYEGHFINDATWDKPKEFKNAGYRIHLIFFGLDNPDLSQFRVTERVTEGGHYVDPTTLRANFFGNLEKLNKYYPIIDDLTIVDTSEINHRILFKKVQNKIEFHVDKGDLPTWFIEHLPSIVNL